MPNPREVMFHNRAGQTRLIISDEDTPQPGEREAGTNSVPIMQTPRMLLQVFAHATSVSTHIFVTSIRCCTHA